LHGLRIASVCAARGRIAPSRALRGARVEGGRSAADRDREQGAAFCARPPIQMRFASSVKREGERRACDREAHERRQGAVGAHATAVAAPVHALGRRQSDDVLRVLCTVCIVPDEHRSAGPSPGHRGGATLLARPVDGAWLQRLAGPAHVTPAQARAAVAPGWPSRVNKSAVIVKRSRRPGRSEERSRPKSAGRRPPPRWVWPLPPNDRCARRSDGRRCAPQPVSGTLRFALLLSTAGRDQDTPSSHHCRNGHQ
jgi:hypothetical protein